MENTKKIIELVKDLNFLELDALIGTLMLRKIRLKDQAEQQFAEITKI